MKKQLFTIAFLVLLVMLLVPVTSWAKISSGNCADCHTMHNSQDGAAMAIDGAGNTTAVNNNSLLIYGCLGCHVGEYTAGSTDAIEAAPKVSGSLLGYASGTSFAGGGFDYGTVASRHNVSGIDAVETWCPVGTAPPGFDADYDDNGIRGGHLTTPWTTTSQQLTCAGTFGCHGKAQDASNDFITDQFQAISGGHHGDDTSIDGLTPAKSYRFLFGIIGYEEKTYETGTGIDHTKHNQYSGVNRYGGDLTEGLISAANQTISYLCCECHGLYHSADASGGDSAAPWIRHPTDFDLTDATGTEYDAYNGTNNYYSLEAPVASAMTSPVNNVAATTTEIISTPLTGTDTAIVTCLSCHRAHGTPYNDLLRWEYTGAGGVQAGDDPTTLKGCTICLTQT